MNAIRRMSPDKSITGIAVGIWLVLCCVLSMSLSHASDDTPTAAPDMSKWACAFCPFGYGWSGDADFGVTGISGGNYSFGNYSGYYDSGVYADVGGNARYRSKDGYYFDASSDNLGLDSRWIDLQGGRQGAFELHGEFRQIPQFGFDSGQTPFAGAGTSQQTLPSNWVYGGSTAQMNSLAGTLRPVDTSTQRRSFDLGADITPSKSHWDFAFDVRHDERSGNQITGANFLTTATQLVQPIDYRTNRIEASVGYSMRTWQVRGGYYGSFFSDGNSALQWTNPFGAIAPGANTGSMSTAPDNAFNQFSLVGGWQILPNTRLMSSLAYGQERQNADFISATINPALTTTALPSASLHGRVDTGNYMVRLSSSPLRHLSIAGEYLIDRRDNKTPQNAYQQVNTDAFVAGDRINLPYSFERRLAKLRVAYRITPQIKLQSGAQRENYDRTFDASLRTRTDSAWLELNSSFATYFDFSAKYSQARRRLNSYQPVSDIALSDNPLLRDFDVANRTRDQWRASISYTPLANFGLDLVLQHNRDTYTDSPIGLTGDSDHNATLDANWRPREKIRLDAFATREFIRYNQAGSQSFSVPDWYGSSRAIVDTFGFSSQWRDLFAHVDAGASYSFSYSRDAIAVATGTATVPFPKNTVNYGAAKLWSRYRINTRTSVRFDYAFERLSTADWALDGVEPDTVSNVLALGINSPRYRVNLFRATFQYVF
ncbi:MAG: MtrB/PioB family decaheme-associated outer membrane protein [Rudaea sp.]